MPKGLFTAGFLARLAYEKYVLGRPVHRIVAALAADGLEWRARHPGRGAEAGRAAARAVGAAIAAHGRPAGHVHADETSWQVFEDVADKENHRWWLWVFVTDDTTVFVMDTSRAPQVAAGQLGIDRDQTALEAGRRLVISSDFHKAYQSLALHRRRGPALVLCPYPAVLPAGRGRAPRRARRLVRGVDRADRGAVPGPPRPGGDHSRHRRPRAGRSPLAAGLHRHRRARILQASDGRRGPAAPGRRQGHRHA